MRILVCHERFLFRFGADRVLILTARGLAAMGHEITMLAHRFDREILESFAHKIIEVSPFSGDYTGLDDYSRTWLSDNWASHFPPGSEPHVILHGGWPFFSAIPFFRERGIPVVFMDCGVVPSCGFAEGHRRVLMRVRNLRRQHLRRCSLLTGISNFILQTQSIPDSLKRVPVRRVLCGADHMRLAMWDSRVSSGKTALTSRPGSPNLLCLGRWEVQGYKNCTAAFALVRQLRAAGLSPVVWVLAENTEEIAAPPDVAPAFVPLGFPDDAELSRIMTAVDAGVCLSLWEGFNLPLAEMQWLGKPAFVFDVGAHPEVAAHPYFLCRDLQTMTHRLAEWLRGNSLPPGEHEAALQRFRSTFTWENVVAEYGRIVDELGCSTAHPVPVEDSRLHILIDVTDSTRDPANSGVIRITRRLSQELQAFEDPLFVIWDSAAGQYVLPTAEEYDQLGQFNGPVPTSELRVSPAPGQRVSLDEALLQFGSRNPWLLLTETTAESRFRNIRPYARLRNLRMAAIFYDAIPVLRPDLCNEEMKQNHAAYMRGLAQCDLIIPISEYSAGTLRSLWTGWGITGTSIETNLLPAEFGGTTRNTEPDTRSSAPVHFLCVSTLEPRKNHRKLLAACLRMQAEHPDLDWKLTLVGNRYAGGDDLAVWVEEVCRTNPRIEWLGIVDDAELLRLYRSCHFTVYASEIEGFGLPVVESLWHGRPCVCHQQGVMSEIAAGGGCLTTDVTDEQELADSIYRLCTDVDLRHNLSAEAVCRPLKQWPEYTRRILALLEAHEGPGLRTAIPQPAGSQAPEPQPAWHEKLYGGCMTGNWQMNDSERLALAALLARHKPRCSVEVGTYKGGSLSLITQYSEMVFSIDIDPEIPHKLASLKRVNFLTGDSGTLLPILLEELTAVGIPVEFILIDGDHSSGGITRDLDIVLGYVPLTPMFVMVHDSMNPGCRAGMLAAAWASSIYCHWVDLDFVPGRIVEHGGGGHCELWGGLALAYFLPVPRTGELHVYQSASMMARILHDASVHNRH